MKKICKKCQFYPVIANISFASSAGYPCQTCKHNPLLTDNYKEDIMPCPFCGSEARIVYDSENEEYTIECFNLDCGAELGWFKTKEKVIRKWNTRIK